ncbi:class I SAM-dependent DNA methyltransferase [Pseudalkalibacillus berkeleyi]|uniref:Methyltransferase domain-containing protein n=1 Tax=Pseudalkalibacillus berkeleyi TaxID=1069813 RepID=A0ABS9GYU7_9BACL|nr:class I SAM-dependent methyltransferase [Pseudalkalibacillus berkeleyi]MCF6136773.1 methyltransferase domain-containing protein [Pseudalkalibacillus berkeleyi]
MILRNRKETLELFDTWAGTYDEYIQDPKGPLLGYESSLVEAASWLEKRSFHSILDIGIGTGNFASRFNGKNIFGVDLSQKMIIECKHQHPDYHLSLGTFTKNNQSSRMFDLTVSSFAFHEVDSEERPDACKETHRILKDEGLFLLVDIMFASKTARDDARKLIGKYWDSSEDYPLISDTDEALRSVGFKSILWKQTGPYHWAVISQK